MIIIKRIQSNNPSYNYIERLLTSAFPEEERRDNQEQRLYTDLNSSFNCNLISLKEEPIGVITYWNLNELNFIEHFAIDPKYRSQGYGKMVLDTIKKQQEYPLVLEVEEPSDSISKRRIEFYQRCGFTLHNNPYLQPPYREGNGWIPMKLMTYGEIDMEIMFEKIKKEIYTNVYKQ